MKSPVNWFACLLLAGAGVFGSYGFPLNFDGAVDGMALGDTAILFYGSSRAEILSANGNIDPVKEVPHNLKCFSFEGTIYGIESKTIWKLDVAQRGFAAIFTNDVSMRYVGKTSNSFLLTSTSGTRSEAFSLRVSDHRRTWVADIPPGESSQFTDSRFYLFDTGLNHFDFGNSPGREPFPLYCFDTSTGKMLWNVQMKRAGMFCTDCVSEFGEYLIVPQESKLDFYSVNDGSLKKSISLPAHNSLSVCASSDHLFAIINYMVGDVFSGLTSQNGFYRIENGRLSLLFPLGSFGVASVMERENGNLVLSGPQGVRIFDAHSLKMIGSIEGRCLAATKLFAFVLQKSPNGYELMAYSLDERRTGTRFIKGYTFSEILRF